MEGNLRDLSQSLKDGSFALGACKMSYPEFFAICDLEDSLQRPFSPYTVNVQFNPDSSRYEVTIGKRKRFEDLLRNYWSEAFDCFNFNPFTKVNKDYRKGWEQIAPIARRTDTLIQLLTGLNRLTCTQPSNLDSICNVVDHFTRDTLQRNGVLSLIKTNSIAYKGTFWFNYGYFSFNPLGFTTPAQNYKPFLFNADAASLHDQVIEDKLNNAELCCNLSVNGLDSLIRQRKSGQRVFSTDTAVADPIWGINDLRTLRTAQKIVNKFESPVTLDDNHPKRSLQFDASSNFYADKANKQCRHVTSDDSVNFVVHNVPANMVVSVNMVSQPTTNTSAFQDAIASLSSVSGLGTAAGAVSLSTFNNLSIPGAYQISNAPAPSKGVPGRVANFS